MNANDCDVSWMQPGWAVVDLEGTGLDPVRNSIVEAAALTWERKHCWASFRVRPGAAVDPVSLEVMGESVMSLDARDVGYFEGMRGWVDFLAKELVRRPLVICGLNPANYDLPMLNHAIPALGLKFWEKPKIAHRVIDLHDRAVVYAEVMGIPIPPGGFETDAIYRMLDLPVEPRPHVALNGVIYECAAFAKIHRTLQKMRVSHRDVEQIQANFAELSLPKGGVG